MAPHALGGVTIYSEGVDGSTTYHSAGPGMGYAPPQHSGRGAGAPGGNVQPPGDGRWGPQLTSGGNVRSSEGRGSRPSHGAEVMDLTGGPAAEKVSSAFDRPACIVDRPACIGAMSVHGLALL